MSDLKKILASFIKKVHRLLLLLLGTSLIITKVGKL